jgi:hypothetical protein
MKRRRPARRDSAQIARRVDALYRRLAPKLPGMDREDLMTILHMHVCPVGSGRMFILKRLPNGGYVI